jgi:Ca-activated chloride channel family protein
MIEISFLRPAVLWLLPAVVLILVAWRLRRGKRHVAFSAVGWLQQLGHRPSVARRLPAALVLLGLVSIVLALMEPVIPYSESEIRAQGLDIVLVLDLSSSMQELMGKNSETRMTSTHLAFSNFDARNQVQRKTRLDTTKEALRDFIVRRREDRIGLVVFSDHAYVVSPMTFDHPSLTDYVDMVDDQILRGEGMTAIGDGMALANFLLERQSSSERRNKVIVVFTDGEHNFGRDPIEVLLESDAANIRVHVVGVDIEQEVSNKPAVQRLISSVRRHGGQYFAANTERQLRAANQALEQLEKGSLRSKAILHNKPAFDWFAIAAIVLIAAGLLFRTIPYFADFT